MDLFSNGTDRGPPAQEVRCRGDYLSAVSGRMDQTGPRTKDWILAWTPTFSDLPLSAEQLCEWLLTWKAAELKVTGLHNEIFWVEETWNVVKSCETQLANKWLLVWADWGGVFSSFPLCFAFCYYLSLVLLPPKKNVTWSVWTVCFCALTQPELARTGINIAGGPSLRWRNVKSI